MVAVPWAAVAGISLWAVVPVLPTLHALLLLVPVALLSLLAALAALRDRRTAAKVLQLLCRQKLPLLLLAALIAAAAWAVGSLRPLPRDAGPGEGSPAARWPMQRGGLERRGVAAGAPAPLAGGLIWSAGGNSEAFYGSPAVVGQRIYAVGSTGDRGRIHCFDTQGQRLWTARPSNYRATFSSPVVGADVLLCGEGLHATRMARLVCVDLRAGREGQLLWTHTTNSHIECTPAIYGDRVYFGAGDDGVYCLSLDPALDQQRRVAWHAPGDRYPDAETSLAVHDGTVYVGLGIGGEAVCALDAESGRELHRAAMPYPVFGVPAIDGDRLYVGMGVGDYVTPDATPAGQVCCLNRNTFEIEWRFATPGTVLGAVAVAGGELIFGCGDGRVYVLDTAGKLLRSWDTRAPIVASPAVTAECIYVVNQDGLLYALARRRTLEVLWEHRLGERGRFLSSPVVAHGSVYVGTEHDGLVRVGRPARSRQLDWPGPLGGPGAAGSRDDSQLPDEGVIVWQFPEQPADGPGGLVTAAVAASGDLILVPVADGPQAGLACLDVSRWPPAPAVRWFHPAANGVQLSPLIVGQRVLLVDGTPGDQGRNLCCLELDSGRPLWQLPVEAGASGELSADRQEIWAVMAPGSLTCVSAAGERLWTRELQVAAEAVPAGPAILLAALAEPPGLVALDRPTGRTLWHVPLDAPAATAPVCVGNRIYLGTRRSVSPRRTSQRRSAPESLRSANESVDRPSDPLAPNPRLGEGRVPRGLEIRALLDGRLLYKTPGEVGSVTGPLHVGDGQFAFVDDGGQLVVGRAADAQPVALVPGARAGTNPIVARNAILFVGRERLMSLGKGLSSGTGPAARVWCDSLSTNQITTPLVLHGGRVYVGTTDRGLVCIQGAAE